MPTNHRMNKLTVLYSQIKYNRATRIDNLQLHRKIRKTLIIQNRKSDKKYKYSKNLVI